jgi:hypothetical protein
MKYSLPGPQAHCGTNNPSNAAGGMGPGRTDGEDSERVLAFITQPQSGAGAITPGQSQLPPWACRGVDREIPDAGAGHTPPLALLHNSNADYVLLPCR